MTQREKWNIRSFLRIMEKFVQYKQKSFQSIVREDETLEKNLKDCVGLRIKSFIFFICTGKILAISLLESLTVLGILVFSKMILFTYN